MPASDAWAAILGVKELELTIQDLLAGVTGDDSLSSGEKTAIIRTARTIIGNHLRDAAKIIKNRAQSIAKAKNWPREAVDSAFAFFDPHKPKRNTSLVGFAKKRSMVEWHAGKSPSPRAKAPVGKLISMALATMFEYGTSKMQARPALRPAIESGKSEALAKVVEGHRRAIMELEWARPISVK